jgi:hypothetical protein
MPNYATLEGQVLRISLKPEMNENTLLTVRNFQKEINKFLFKWTIHISSTQHLKML